MPNTETQRETFEANWPHVSYVDKAEESLHEATTYAELAVVALEEVVRRYDSEELPDPLPDLAMVGQLAALQLSVEDHASRLNNAAHRLGRLVRRVDMIRRETERESE